MGDINAHFGSRVCDNPQQSCNSRGHWLNLCESLSLHNISLSSLSSRTSYTYSSGGHISTVDYILEKNDAVREICTCNTLEEHSLNTSDHLPIHCTFDVTHMRHPIASSPAFPSQHLDWHQAKRTGLATQYARICNETVSPL